MRRGTLAFQATPDPAAGGEKPDERPAWLPENFKTPEDLAKAYDESRKEMNRAQTERDQERQQFAAALEAMEQRRPVITPQNGDDPNLAAFTQAIESGDAAAMFRIQTEAAAAKTTERMEKLLEEKFGNIQPVLDQQQQAQREASIRMAEDVVARNLPDGQYAELLPEISKAVQEHPHYLPAQASVEGYAAAILDVAKLVQHDKLQAQITALETERAEKLQAQTVQGAGRPSAFSEDEQKAEFERIKNTKTGSFAEVMRNAARS